MKKLFKWIGYALGACIVLFVVGAIFGEPTRNKSSTQSQQSHDATNSSSSQSPSKSPLTDAPPPAEIAKISAIKLFDDYHANEVAADQRYKGKRLRVSGTVQGIDKSLFDQIVIQLRTSNEFIPVLSHLDGGHESFAASLSKGKKLTLECKVGGMIVGMPTLQECAPI